MVINRNGIVFGSVPVVNLPGPQDIPAPTDGDDGSYYFAPPGTSRSTPAPTSSSAPRLAARTS